MSLTPEEQLAQLCDADLAGQALRILPFWGHRPERDGSAGKGCLSQWWPASFTVNDITYLTAEHWMMAGKARLFSDAEGLAAVLAAKGPGAAKAAGRKVRGFHEKVWATARYGLVVAGNRAKFEQNPGLQLFLRATGKKILVEASPYDRIWGVGMAPSNPDIHHPAKWRGQNLLGFALMQVRDEL